MAGASEFFDLAKDFGAAPAKVATALYTAFKAEGDEFADDWRAFARPPLEPTRTSTRRPSPRRRSCRWVSTSRPARRRADRACWAVFWSSVAFTRRRTLTAHGRCRSLSVAWRRRRARLWSKCCRDRLPDCHCGRDVGRAAPLSDQRSPASPTYPYLVYSVAGDRGDGYTLDSRRGFRWYRIVLQSFGKTLASALETDAAAVDDLLDVPLAVSGFETRPSRMEIASAIVRDPDNQGVVGVTTTLTFTAKEA